MSSKSVPPYNNNVSVKFLKVLMSSWSAEAAATATGRCGVGSYRLAIARLAGRPGISIVAVRIGIRRPVIIIVAVAIGRVLAVPGAGRVIRRRGPGAIGPVITAAGAGSQAIVVAGAIKGPQVRIDRGRRIFGTYYQHTAAIIRVVEIGIIPAIPHKVAVPAHIRIAESQSERRTESESQAITISGIAISISTADAGRIVGVIRAVIVKIRPAGRILDFESNILIVRRCAVIVTLLGGTAIVFILVAAGCGYLIGSR